MFPLPGAPRQQPMDPSKLQAFMNQPAGTAGTTALKPSNARQSKRLFIHNLPPSATEEAMVNFFNLQLNGLNVVSSVDPVISAQIAKDRSFALLEFKNPTDATVALALDGITMEDDGAMDTGAGAMNGTQGTRYSPTQRLYRRFRGPSKTSTRMEWYLRMFLIPLIKSSSQTYSPV